MGKKLGAIEGAVNWSRVNSSRPPAYISPGNEFGTKIIIKSQTAKLFPTFFTKKGEKTSCRKKIPPKPPKNLAVSKLIVTFASENIVLIK